MISLNLISANQEITRIDCSTPNATNLSICPLDTCWESFRNALNNNQQLKDHQKENIILICPQCQCQAELLIAPQTGRASWIIRITLMLTFVLSCFAFKPCLLNELKEYQYRCITCKSVVKSFKGYEFT